jgi:C4-dicarboxylate transporter, DctM subunit
MAFVGVLFLAFVFLGIPIFVSLALTGLIGLWFTHGVPLAVIAAKTASASDSFVLLAIPLFLLAGSLMSNGGIAQRLFDLARALVGHVPGGLAQVNIALSVLNGGISGSSAADAALDSKVTIPQMQAQGYPAAFSGAITAASAMLSNIIPPSIAMLVYASISNTSVGKLFMAGIVPGLFMAAAMSITAHRTCRRLGYGPPRSQRAPWSHIAKALRRSWIALSLPVIVVGGIRLLHAHGGRRDCGGDRVCSRHVRVSGASSAGVARDFYAHRDRYRRHHAHHQLLGAGFADPRL